MVGVGQVDLAGELFHFLEFFFGQPAFQGIHDGFGVRRRGRSGGLLQHFGRLFQRRGLYGLAAQGQNGRLVQFFIVQDLGKVLVFFAHDGVPPSQIVQCKCHIMI